MGTLIVEGTGGGGLNVTCVEIGVVLPSNGGSNPDAVILCVVEFRPCTKGRLEDGTS